MSTYEKFAALIDLAIDKNLLSGEQGNLLLTNVRPSYELVEIMLDYVSRLIVVDSESFVHSLLASH
jgi:hypothetical protein